MKYETPKMSISMFEVENVVTTSGPTTEQKLQTAVSAAQAGTEMKNAQAVLNFAF